MERAREIARSGRLERAARGLLAALSVWYVGVFLYIAARRVGYPYDLEWMEGGIYEHVARVLEGRPLYVAPALDFTPYIYAPLYYWVSAVFVTVLGPGLPSLRLVSVLGTLVVFAALFELVRRGTRDRLCALFAVGVFAGCFAVGGSWFDIARVDMLQLAFVMVAVALLMRSERFDLLAGALLGIAFLTKQSTLVIALPLLAARLITQQGWRRVHAPAMFAAVFGLGNLALDRASGGWYSYYAFQLPASHPIADEAWLGFWRNDLFGALPFACAGLLFLLVQPQPWRTGLTRLALCCGLLGSGWSGRLHTGGHTNVLLPAFLLLSWGLAEALHVWTTARGTSARFAYLLCALQLGFLWYPPGRQLPSAADRRAGDRLVAALSKARGDVLVPYHGHLARLAGKPPHGHDMAFRDVLAGADESAKQQFSQSVLAALRERRYSVIVVDKPWWQGALEQHYTRADARRWLVPGTLMSLIGYDVAPTDVYVPKDGGMRASTPTR